MIRERFAPSPTGLLHLGHAYSALTAYSAAQEAGGQFLLRIEDIDGPRCKAKFEAQIYKDLEWLGLRWEMPVFKQSNRMDSYQRALQTLQEMGLTYECSCNRTDIKAALSATQEGGESYGPDGLIYPGICKTAGANKDKPAAIRLNMEAALPHLPDPITFTELGGTHEEIVQTSHAQLLSTVGDIVLARKDIGTSYHLAVTVDDAYQEITRVTRGKDMKSATPIHRVLQILLDLPEPRYRHHKLIRDENGKRLAKRDDARAIQKYRDDGITPAELRRLLGL